MHKTDKDIGFEYSTSNEKQVPYISLTKTEFNYNPDPFTEVTVVIEDKNLEEIVEQIKQKISEQKPRKSKINLYCENSSQIPVVERLQSY